MRTHIFLFVALAASLHAEPLADKPDDAYFKNFNPAKPPAPSQLLLREGDRLAICGDSITEQKMYSRIIETYLTVAVPDLKITVRQFGWSGETVPGFLSRIKNDTLRFHPTIATTCYGMNDHGYRPYEADIGENYRKNSTAMVEEFKKAGVRVILGSPGCVGKVPAWAKAKDATMENLNLNLCELRDIDIDIAAKEGVGFADVFWPMLVEGFTARQKYGPDYALAGKDGVHPGWAGHLVMADAFLKAMGLDGNIGAFTVDMAAGKATASPGHEVLLWDNGALSIKSSKFPFCADPADPADDSAVSSGMALSNFNKDLNRLTLIVKNPKADHYRVTWGQHANTYSAEELANGINLAADFPANPFSEAFKKVDSAVADKQVYETRQIKELFHGPEGNRDMEATATLTEEVRQPLAEAIAAAFKPVTHTIHIEPQ